MEKVEEREREREGGKKEEPTVRGRVFISCTEPIVAAFSHPSGAYITALRKSRSRFSFFGKVENAWNKVLKHGLNCNWILVVRILNGQAIFVALNGTPSLAHNNNWTSHRFP